MTLYTFILLAPPLSGNIYIRFSSPSLVSIRSDLNLASNSLVFGVIETVGLEFARDVQLIVKCSDVTS